MKQEIDTLLNLAYIYMNYGKTKRAIDYLLIAYRMEPDNLQIKKMQIAAFRDIGAYSQALDIIKEIENNDTLPAVDKLTLKLIKSFCLRGLDRLDEGRKVFGDYIAERKELAKKEFMKNHRKKLMTLSQAKLDETYYQSGEIDTQKDIHHFVKNNHHLHKAGLSNRAGLS